MKQQVAQGVGLGLHLSVRHGEVFLLKISDADGTAECCGGLLIQRIDHYAAHIPVQPVHTPELRHLELRLERFRHVPFGIAAGTL